MTTMRYDVEEDEPTRIARLVDAESRADELFDAVVSRGLLTPGITERAASDAVRDLAADMLGVSRWWHKRIVRAGPNTLLPYRENPPDRTLTEDDIVFLDFGPIFEEWEADYGRTYVLGDDPAKHALCDALPQVWRAGREHFESTPDITGAQLYDHMLGLGRDAGWEFGGHIAGHLVGQFPHEKIYDDSVDEHIMPGSDRPMRRADDAGLVCHWILEVHLVDRERQIGGFFEQLLDIGPGLPG
jgi:Xaa-Pro aminopeptidase